MTNKFLLSIFVFSLSLSALAERIEMFSMGRRFTLVTPSSRAANRPLLVVLHGCKQNPKLMLEGTQLEAEAEKGNFYLLLPEQPNYYNIDHCWNWFIGLQQVRAEANEMGQIISAVEALKEEYRVDADKVYLTGISAGGVMAHNLTVCYPDVFAGSAIHSGLTFKVAESIPEAQTVLTSYQQKSPDYLGKKAYECGRSAKNKRLDRVMIIHGLEDSRVPSFHSELISKSQAVWRDYADDGKKNGSVKPVVTVETVKSKGYAVQKIKSKYPNFTEERLMIKGLGHAWGGGKPVSVNFDPKAPSSNKFILDFFQLNK